MFIYNNSKFQLRNVSFKGAWVNVNTTLAEDQIFPGKKMFFFNGRQQKVKNQLKKNPVCDEIFIHKLSIASCEGQINNSRLLKA